MTTGSSILIGYCGMRALITLYFWGKDGNRTPMCNAISSLGDYVVVIALILINKL